MNWLCSWLCPPSDKVPLWASDLGQVMLKVLSNQVAIMEMLNKLRLDQEKINAIYEIEVADKKKIDDELAGKTPTTNFNKEK